MLNSCVTRLVSERPKLELSEVILMQVALLQFASQCYPGRLEYVNHCIGEFLACFVSARTRFFLFRHPCPPPSNRPLELVVHGVFGPGSMHWLC